MPIEGGDPKYNKNENKKPFNDNNPTTGKPSDDSAKSSFVNKVEDAKDDLKNRMSKASGSSSSSDEKKPNSLMPKTQPTKEDTSKLESSKISDASKDASKKMDNSSASKPGDASAGAKPNGMKPGASDKPSVPAPPGNGLAGALGQQKKPTDGSKDTGAAAASSLSGKPNGSKPTDPKANGSKPNDPSNKNAAKDAIQDEDDRNPVVKFFIKIRDSIKNFCCQTEDTLRHVA